MNRGAVPLPEGFAQEILSGHSLRLRGAIALALRGPPLQLGIAAVGRSMSARDAFFVRFGIDSGERMVIRSSHCRNRCRELKMDYIHPTVGPPFASEKPQTK